MFERIVDVNKIVEELEPGSIEDLAIGETTTHGIRDEFLDNYHHARTELGVSHMQAICMCLG